MKRRVGTVLFLMMMTVIMGCGKGSEPVGNLPEEGKPTVTIAPEVTEAILGETSIAPEVTVTPEVTEAEKVTPIPEVTEEVEEGIPMYELSSAGKRTGTDSFDNFDMIQAYSYETTNNPYYVGRENYEDNIDFLKNTKTEEDGCLYIGLPLYLPDKVSRDAVYFSVSDSEIARIEGDKLIGVKQGTFVLSSYDSEKKHLADKKYVVTTYNDSKENKESHMTIKISEGSHVTKFVNARDVEYCKKAICTIMDM